MTLARAAALARVAWEHELMKHRIECPLDTAVARARLDEAFAQSRSRLGRYRPELEWIDPCRARFAFSVRGMRVCGELALDREGLDLSADAPLPLHMFRGVAVRLAEAELLRVVADARRVPERART